MLLCLLTGGGTPSSPGYPPVQTWDGVPSPLHGPGTGYPHLDLGWGTAHLDLVWGTPCQPHGVPPWNVNRQTSVKTVPSLVLRTRAVTTCVNMKTLNYQTRSKVLKKYSLPFSKYLRLPSWPFIRPCIYIIQAESFVGFAIADLVAVVKKYK